MQDPVDLAHQASILSHNRSALYTGEFIEQIVRPLLDADGVVSGTAHLPSEARTATMRSTLTTAARRVRSMRHGAPDPRADQAEAIARGVAERDVDEAVKQRWRELTGDLDGPVYDVRFLDAEEEEEEEEGEVLLGGGPPARLGDLSSPDERTRLRGFRALPKDCPFYEAAKTMIAQLLYWRHDPSDEEERERKKTHVKKTMGPFLPKEAMYPLADSLSGPQKRENVHYYLVAHVWFAFLRPFLVPRDVTKMAGPWKTALLTGTLPQKLQEHAQLPYFWWSSMTELGARDIRKTAAFVGRPGSAGKDDTWLDALTNMRGLLFYLIRQVYAPMLHTARTMLPDNTGGKRDAAPALARFAPAESLLDSHDKGKNGLDALIAMLLGVLCTKGEQDTDLAQVRNEYIRVLSDLPAKLKDADATVDKFERMWAEAQMHAGEGIANDVRRILLVRALRRRWDKFAAGDASVQFMLAVGRWTKPGEYAEFRKVLTSTQKGEEREEVSASAEERKRRLKEYADKYVVVERSRFAMDRTRPDFGKLPRSRTIVRRGTPLTATARFVMKWAIDEDGDLRTDGENVRVVTVPLFIEMWTTLVRENVRTTALYFLRDFPERDRAAQYLRIVAAEEELYALFTNELQNIDTTTGTFRSALDNARKQAPHDFSAEAPLSMRRDEESLWKVNESLFAGKYTGMIRTLFGINQYFVPLGPPKAWVRYRGYEPMGNRGVLTGEEEHVWRPLGDPFTDPRVERVLIFDATGKFPDPPTERLTYDPRAALFENTLDNPSARFTAALVEMLRATMRLSRFDGDFISLQMLPLQLILRHWLSVQTASAGSIVPFRDEWIERSGSLFFSEVDMRLLMSRPEFVGVKKKGNDELEKDVRKPRYRLLLDPSAPHREVRHLFGIDRILENVHHVDADLAPTKDEMRSKRGVLDEVKHVVEFASRSGGEIKLSDVRFLFRMLHELYYTGGITKASVEDIDRLEGSQHDLFALRNDVLLRQDVRDGDDEIRLHPGIPHRDGKKALGVLFRRFHRANYPQKPKNHNVLGYIAVPDDIEEYRTIPLAQRYQTSALVSRVMEPSLAEMKGWDTLEDHLSFAMNLTDYFSRHATPLSVGWQIVQWLNRSEPKVPMDMAMSEFIGIFDTKFQFREGCPVVSTRGRHGYVQTVGMDHPRLGEIGAREIVRWLPRSTFELKKKTRKAETVHEFNTVRVGLMPHMLVNEDRVRVRGYGEHRDGSTRALEPLFDTLRFPLDDAVRYVVQRE